MDIFIEEILFRVRSYEKSISRGVAWSVSLTDLIIYQNLLVKKQNKTKKKPLTILLKCHKKINTSTKQYIFCFDIQWLWV